MIVVTGGAGFIGSAIVWQLNRLGRDDIIIVDHLGDSEKWKNLRGLHFLDYIEKNRFLSELYDDECYSYDLEAIFHMGACSSTTETDASYLIYNNYEYSKYLSLHAATQNIPFVYASSAATYGDGSQGFVDNEERLGALRPMNMYGYSKQIFDNWAKRRGLLKRQTGLKFFNVYGPNEYHKGDMRSVVHKAYGQIQDTGKINLFQSHRSDYEHGEQKRDFLYVKDAAAIAVSLWQSETHGLFNVGSGRARTWNDLGRGLFAAMERSENIEYIPMPSELQDKYQYFTESDNTRLQDIYDKPFYSLEEGIADYVRNYLDRDAYLGDETG